MRGLIRLDMSGHRQPSLVFVAGGKLPVGAEPEDGAMRFVVEEGVLGLGLHHGQGRVLIEVLAGRLGEKQRFSDRRVTSYLGPIPGEVNHGVP